MYDFKQKIYQTKLNMKNTLKLIVLLIISIPFVNISAQQTSGKIIGKIIDLKTNEELFGATVQIEGTQIGANADLEGNYMISVEPGNYNLLFSYLGFNTIKMPVTVMLNESLRANVAMEELSNTLNDIVITATVEKSSAVALLATRKNSIQVSDGISADIIRKSPDRTTADVLKRVTGASIQEGKFAIIRGMNDRYNSGYLDGALLPSTESDRKAFSFDVIPANLIDNIQIIKAGSPDLIGDFGGGIIKINTKAIPEEFTQSISLGLQTHSLTTFKDFTQSKVYMGEELNMINHKRDIPSFSEGALKSSNAFPSSEEKTGFAAITKSFNNDWSTSNFEAMPDTKASYSLSAPIRINNEHKIGVLFALNYSSTKKITESNINTFDGGGQVSAFNDKNYNLNVSSGGLLNLNYIGEKTQINFRNLVNINSDNNTIIRNGIGSIGDAIDVRSLTNVVNYNKLTNSIVSLKQIVGENFMTINAAVNYSNVNRKIPDYKIVNYTKTPDFEDYMLTIGDFFNTSSGRFYSNLNEDLYGANLDLSKRFDTNKIKTEIKAGAFVQNRNRSFVGRSFVYNGTASTPTYNPDIDLGTQNIGADKLYLLEKTSDDLAYYNGKSLVNAYYLMADQKYSERLKAVYGVRYELADIKINNNKINSEIADIKNGIYLPSVNLNYSLSEKMNLRAGFYKSVNRPEFRELAPFAFFAFDKNAEIRGNKDLKVANLNNFELRWELYPTGSEILSAGAFYKTIENPIEFNIDITQPFTTFTYSNGKSANVYGLEFEFKKRLDFIAPSKTLSNITFFSNLALIKSQLSFEAGSQAKQDRPLQGQSPYILNIGLQYDNKESGWFGNVIFNQIGRRIAYVGVDPKYGDTRQDIYEAPRAVVDMQIGKNIGKFNLKFTVGDLLHNDLIYYQDTNQNGKFDSRALNSDRQMFKFNNGLTMSLSAGFTF